MPQTFPAPCATAARHPSQHSPQHHFSEWSTPVLPLKPILQTYRNWRTSALCSCQQVRQSQCWGQRGRASLQAMSSPVPKCLQDLSTSRHYWTRANSCLLYQGLLHIPRTCHRKSLHMLTPGNRLGATRASTGCWHGQDGSKTGPSLGSKCCLLEPAEILLLMVGNSQDHRVH